jgi:hypothetical protein
MQTPRRSIASGILAIAVAIAAVPLLGQELALKYIWPKGEELRYQFATEATITMSGIPGMGDMTTVTSTAQVQQMVGDSVAADGAATVRIKIEAIKTTTSNPMTGAVSYDSAAPAAANDPTSAQLAGIYGPMIGATLTATIAPNGAVRTLEGMAKLAATTQAAQQMAAGLGMSAGDLMSDEAMKATYQNFGSLPDKPVKPGDTWKREVTRPNPLGAQTVSSTFTVKGVEQLDGHEVIRIGVVETTKTAPGGMMGPLSVQVGDGTGQGDVLFNAKLGRLERCTIDATMPMTMSMSLPDGSAMSLQASSQSKTTVQLVKK